MRYSDTTLATTGIIQREEALCNLGNGGISGNDTLLKQFAGYNNAAYHEVWMAEMSANKVWKADDYNYNDYPDAPIALVASQSDYTLPVATTGANVATFLRLNGVYHTKNGVPTYLRPMEPSEDLLEIDGVPSAYRVHGKSLFLDVQPSSTFVADVTNLHVEFQRTPDAFAYDDTTQQPGFMETYHELIPLKASALYLLPINPTLSNLYEERFRSRLELFKSDVASLDDSFGSNITSEYINFR